MRILLTNDDGVHAPGLRAFRKELLTLGEVTVVAPASEQSAAGHSVTLLTPLIVQRVSHDGEEVGWAVEGRPADCVKLALLELLPEPPDLIVSGINAGSNSGINVLYSGTVAAAIEGAFFRKTAVAVSLEYTNLDPLNFAQAAGYAVTLIRQMLESRPEPGSLFNVNVPSLEEGPPRGVKVVPQGVASFAEKFDRRTDPRGRTYYWAGRDFSCPDPHRDSDVAALAERFITLTPLQFDLTDHARLAAMQRRDWSI